MQPRPPRHTAHALRRPHPTTPQRSRPAPSRTRHQDRHRLGRISHYETGKITPSADALVRLVETFGVSCDYLLIDDAPRRPFRSPEDTLGEHLHQLTELTPHGQQLVISFIDALVTKTRLKTLAGGIN
ncbi:MAG: helix-turn-helix transcriptional regulator [Actinobacteria bacterium]|nr:helix-turn-helix transcriptional regulator [Actinomycetota bacterium]